MLDITIFPLTLDTGREQYELPGFYVASAPRRAARLRAQDKLILYCRLLNLMGEVQPAAFTHSQQEEIFKGLAETYFTTPGSVTAGLRAVVVRLNEFLFHRNRKGGASSQLFGVLNLAALHGDSLMIAHGGPAHTFLLSDSQAAHYNDSASGGRGLGLAGQVVPRFYQAALGPGSLLILSSDVPANWTPKMLADGGKLPFDQLRRRLVTGVTTDVSAAVIRFQPGKGQVSYWRPSGQPAVQAPVAALRPSQPSIKAETAQVSIMPPGETAAPPPAEQQETPPVEAAAEISPALPESPEQAPSPDETVVDSGPAQIFEVPASPSVLDSASDQEQAVESFEPSPDTLTFSTENAAEELEPPAISAVPQVNEPDEPFQKPGIYLGDAAAKEVLPAAPAPRPARRIENAVPLTPDSTGLAQQDEQSQAARRRRKGDQKSGLFGGLRLPWRPDAQREPASPRQAPSAGRKSPLRMASPNPDALQADATSPIDAFMEPGPAGEPAVQPVEEPRSENLRRGLASAVRSGRKARARVGSAAAKVLPNQPFFNLSSGVMLSIAIVIPLIVVAVALTVYLRSGYSEKFAAKMAMAQQFLQQAQQLQDPIQQRDAWKQVYILVNDALSYEPNNQPARDLRRQALASIDNLEGFVRLDYQPLRDGLGTNVKITRMVATLTGVYLLDSNQGQVYRLQSTASGYSVDPNFNCGPGKAGSQIITQLIDIAELPVNNQFHADIMAIDAGGNLVYCSSGAEGFDSQVLNAPANGWGTITAVTSLGDSLFVLDPKGNAVYRYDGENGIYNNGPHLYFDVEIPHMSDVIDLAVDQEFLYLLHASGQMTVCDSGGVSYAKTKCTDPTPYGDSRPGFEPSPLVFADSRFSHIQATQPPDPALFALDVKNRSIYHMSLRLLNLQRQYLPQPETDFPLPDSAPTAFVVTTNRRALLAFGNQIFFAQIP